MCAHLAVFLIFCYSTQDISDAPPVDPRDPSERMAQTWNSPGDLDFGMCWIQGRGSVARGLQIIDGFASVLACSMDFTCMLMIQETPLQCQVLLGLTLFRVSLLKSGKSEG